VTPDETLDTFFGDEPARPSAPAAPGRPPMSAVERALVEQACTKSGVLWVRPEGGDRPHAAWHVWHDGAVHLVYGVDEQMLPLLQGRVEITVPSAQTRVRLVAFEAQAHVLSAHTPEWEAAATALSAARLNAVLPEQQRERWAAGTLITRLDPLWLVYSGPGGDETPSGAAPPPESSATTVGRRPYHLGDRSRRARRQARRR
jgi:hypothetical protein